MGLGYREAVAADAGFLQALRSSVFLQIMTELTLATVLPRTRFTPMTSDSASPRSVADPYLSLARL